MPRFIVHREIFPIIIMSGPFNNFLHLLSILISPILAKKTVTTDKGWIPTKEGYFLHKRTRKKQRDE
jgi:hypothetical protein